MSLADREEISRGLGNKHRDPTAPTFADLVAPLAPEPRPADVRAAGPGEHQPGRVVSQRLTQRMPLPRLKCSCTSVRDPPLPRPFERMFTDPAGAARGSRITPSTSCVMPPISRHCTQVSR